jgi:hypothetical protein
VFQETGRKEVRHLRGHSITLWVSNELSIPVLLSLWFLWEWMKILPF